MCDGQAKARAKSDATMADALACLSVALSFYGQPRRYLDVGCGHGHLPRAMAGMGIPAVGVDIGVEEQDADPCLLRRDLTLPVLDVGTADLVTCWEVAEHLPQEAAEVLCDTLARVTENRLLFTAAVPGQGGPGHINEQPHEYWLEHLRQRGLGFVESETAVLRAAFATAAPRAWWYGRNLMVFSR